MENRSWIYRVGYWVIRSYIGYKYSKVLYNWVFTCRVAISRVYIIYRLANSQKQKDITIGIGQEDSTQAPVYALSPSPLAQASSRIDIGIRQGNSQIIMRISPDAGSEINLRITPPIRSSPIDEWFDIDAYEPQREPQSEPQSEP